MTSTPTSPRAMQVAEPGGPFTLVHTDLPEPGPGRVRIAVAACGICHSDAMITGGMLPGVTFPVTTGHEIAGRVDALGPGADGWQAGDRVAVGWYGGSCGYCGACRSGDAVNCARLEIPGAAYPGGYADTVVVPAVALARVPDELTSVEAAPLACAGVTVFNALRRSAAVPGDLVAVLGIGGLGHLGVQFASKMGFRTVAIARGAEKAKLAYGLGARHYIDSTAENVADALQELGGAKAVLATVTNGPAMTATFDGLGRRGELIVVGATPDEMTFSGTQFINGTKKVYGHASGTAVDTEDTLRFAAQTGVRSWTEEAPLEEADEAFARMLSGSARFRMVLTTGR
ncbi:alcohol dehydrogenase catalytic domain-containing protein [Streptomyces sp. SID10853]|uniref:alcohol dehydrogenase catalytic domain-containing protein n=1 Tax=Streptomyces sp. SID10853 TaxID=2706028 RepID=UPI0013C07EF9|nr:alcohol dehydrogenase catalytic domain-containing protein [Streptomyces sp. SID10853]NDZ78714.1 alcohol dehydrogenase catalytic domain-containing protein [Streptomyces sp. SID10853]